MKAEIRSAGIRKKRECWKSCEWQLSSLNPNGIQAFSPGLRGTSYPGSGEWVRANPNGVVSAPSKRRRNPVGVEIQPGNISQGSSFLATLGLDEAIPLGLADLAMASAFAKRLGLR